MPCTGETLWAYLDARKLWPLLSVPEGLHTVLNHSVTLRSLLESSLPADTMSALSAELVLACGFPLDKKLRAGWQWRYLWSVCEAFERHLHGQPKHLLLVRTFSQIIVALYAEPEYRNAKTLLRLTVNSFVHASLWRDLGGKQQLSSHFIFRT